MGNPGETIMQMCIRDSNCTERQVSICAKDSHGPYHYATVSALVAAAEEQGIDFAIDIYPHYGSDADAALDEMCIRDRISKVSHFWNLSVSSSMKSAARTAC